MKLIGFRVAPKKAETIKSEPVKRRRSRRRRRRRGKAPRAAVLGMLLVILLLAITIVAQKTLLRQGDANLRYVEGIAVHEDFLPKETLARTGVKREILYVVIHETDNVKVGANAQGHNKFIHNNGISHELSWHYTVDDHEIWHHLPDDEAAFHAGDRMSNRGGNKNGIGVEMCVNEDGNFEQTLINTQKLAAALLHEYGLSMDALKKHEDFSGKQCPATLLRTGRWDEFSQGVQVEFERLQADG